LVSVRWEGDDAPVQKKHTAAASAA